MPELAEVEYYRKQWARSRGCTVREIHLHASRRIFRGTDTRELQERICGSVLGQSDALGKQLLFKFSGDLWLGIHLGMSGKLLCEDSTFKPGKHDHLVFFLDRHSLIFQDPRMFGRIRFAVGGHTPEWWGNLVPAVNSSRFTHATMESFLVRHPKLPIKAALLNQSGFPGVGNWMADEILWRAKVHPRRIVSEVNESQRAALWMSLRFVVRGAMRSIGRDFSDPPVTWLFHWRWQDGGTCPIHRTVLHRESVGGRTTAWCEKCQV